MFIELTDHLRCPRNHDEAFLVLLPDRIEQRDVIAGHLGCPVCGWSTAWSDSVPDFGDAWASTGAAAFDAEAAVAMLGIDGPGGWIALAGSAGMLAEGLMQRVPGVNVVAVNPPASVEHTSSVSSIRGAAWPIKTHSMRGIVLGSDTPADWARRALASTLPGLRLVGAGPVPDAGTELLAHAGGVWVMRAG